MVAFSNMIGSFVFTWGIGLDGLFDPAQISRHALGGSLVAALAYGQAADLE